MHSQQEVKDFLEEKWNQFERPVFIEDDPIQIPHHFTRKEDIEISGFLTATIAWGQRKTIINNAKRMMELMDNSPYTFVTQGTNKDFKRFDAFVHRTFQPIDMRFFLKSLQHIYLNRGGLEKQFQPYTKEETLKHSIVRFRDSFFELPHEKRTEKHVSNPATGASAKRINMFLRWMVRSDEREVDFGIWNSIKPSQLSCPLDVHTGNVARKLGLIKRNANDWKALEELDAHLRAFDSTDPVKYDFALFGLGVHEGF